MSWTVTLAGETFTDANVAGTAYADEATGFPAILAAFAREAAFLKGLAATSSTLVTPAVGPVVLATHQSASASGLSAGMLVRVTSVADPGRLMVGTVTSFAGTTLALAVTFAAGAAAGDWLITRPIAGPALALDPSPTLAADLDAAGRSIHGIADAELAGSLAVAGRASFGAAGESRVGYLGEISGDVPIRSGDPMTLVCTIVGNTTFLVAGAFTPGHEHAHKIRATVGGAGGWSVGVLPASLLTRSNDLADTMIDTGWQQGNVTCSPGIATPAGGGWTVAGSGSGIHYIQVRRATSASPFDYVGAVLLKAGGTSRARLRVRLDTIGHGAHVDFDLGAGTAGVPVNGALGTALASGIRPVGGGWLVAWLVVDVAATGYGLILELSLLNAAGASSFAAAGESLLFGGATLSAGATYHGFQQLGPSRAGSVVWQGAPIVWPSLAAGTAVDLMLHCDPDRIIQQDYTPEEI